MVQHNASINYGSSGGPIVNTDGQLVAVNTFGIKRQDTRTFNLNPGVDALADINSYNDLQNKVNEGYAPSSDFNQNGGIHVDVVKKFLEAYRNSTGVPFLDAYGSSVSPSQAAFWGLPKEYGFWLSGLQDSFYKIDEPGVIKDGDLAAAGLQNNDLITALNGTQLERQGIGTILINLEPGKEVSLEFYHQNEDKTWSQKQTTVKISLIKLWGEADLNGMQIGELKL
jgi:S1-C subfamily serine protease